MSYIIFLIFTLLGCSKEVGIVCDDSDKIQKDSIDIKFLWSVPLNNTGSEEVNVDLFLLNKDKIITVSEGEETVRCFSIPDSSYIWKYSGFNFHRYSSYALDLEKNIFAGCYFNYTTSLNLESGKEFWQDDISPFPSGKSRMNILNDYFYHSHDDLSGANRYSALVRKPLTIDQTWDTLLILDAIEFNNFSPGFIGPSLWIHPYTNDSILIIPIRMVEFDKNLRRSDLVAFNLNTREILWQVEDFTGIVTVDQPIIHNGYVYVMSAKEIFAFNLLDGNLVWKYTETNQWANFVGGRLQIVDNKLILGEISGSVVNAIDPLNGELIWRHEENFGFAPCRHDIIVYKNYIIIGYHDRLDVFDVLDGKHVYKIRMSFRRFRGRMALDESNRKLYVPEDSEVACYELPEKF